jgi:cytochrome P450
MLHDEEEYPDPESFKPERFINDDKNVSRNPADIIFGFGRRFVLVKITLIFPTKIIILI